MGLNERATWMREEVGTIFPDDPLRNVVETHLFIGCQVQEVCRWMDREQTERASEH
jgi:hypothetical protein